MAKGKKKKMKSRLLNLGEKITDHKGEVWELVAIRLKDYMFKSTRTGKSRSCKIFEIKEGENDTN